MVGRREIVGAGLVLAAGALVGVSPLAKPLWSWAQEAAEPAAAVIQTSVDVYGNQITVGPDGVRFLYPAVTWSDLQTFVQIMLADYAVNLFDEAVPRGWTHRYEAVSAVSDDLREVLQVLPEGSDAPLFYAYLAPAANQAVPADGLTVIYTSTESTQDGKVVQLACAPDSVATLQDLLHQGLLYASPGLRDDRFHARAIRDNDSIRVLTPYYEVRLDPTQIEPGWGFMLVENPEPKADDALCGYHCLQVVLGENGPAFGVQCFDTPGAQADDAYGRVPVESVRSSDGKLVAVVPEGDNLDGWADRAAIYADWVRTAPAGSWTSDTQYLRTLIVGDDTTLVETPYYAVRFPVAQRAWTFSYTNSVYSPQPYTEHTVAHSMSAQCDDDDAFPSWMQYFCQLGGGSAVWDGPLAFALSDTMTPDGLTVGVGIGMSAPSSDGGEGIAAGVAESYAQCVEPLPADAAVPPLEEILLYAPLADATGIGAGEDI